MGPWQASHPSHISMEVLEMEESGGGGGGGGAWGVSILADWVRGEKNTFDV